MTAQPGGGRSGLAARAGRQHRPDPRLEHERASRRPSAGARLGRHVSLVGLDGLTPAFVAKQVSAMTAWRS